VASSKIRAGAGAGTGTGTGAGTGGLDYCRGLPWNSPVSEFRKATISSLSLGFMVVPNSYLPMISTAVFRSGAVASCMYGAV